MIKCIAIDDEPLALKKLVTYIKKVRGDADKCEFI